MSSDGAEASDRMGPFRLILLAALLLAIGVYVLEFLLSYLLRVSLQNTFFTPGLSELYNLATSFALFVFDPVICFLVFYKIGGTSDFDIGSSYLRLMKYAFVGGVLGYGIGFLANIGLNALITNSSLFFSEANWFVFAGQLILGLARGGIDITLLAFAGVVVGTLRSKAKSTSAGLEVKPAEESSPV